MDPSASDEVGDECKESRKIHFAVQSSAPTQLDPRQVEMVSERIGLTRVEQCLSVYSQYVFSLSSVNLCV